MSKNGIKEFLDSFPDYTEVQNVVKFFQEVTPEPYRFRRGVLVGEIQENLEADLKRTTDGAYLSFGYYDENCDYLWEKGKIVAGVFSTGVWAAGHGSGQKHDVYVSLDDNYLTNERHVKVFELIARFYGRFLMDDKVDEKHFFDGVCTKHPPF